MMRKKSKERDREGEDEQESFEHVHTTAAASATMPEADTHYSKNVLYTFLTHIIFPSLSRIYFLPTAIVSPFPFLTPCIMKIFPAKNRLRT